MENSAEYLEKILDLFLRKLEKHQNIKGLYPNDLYNKIKKNDDNIPIDFPVTRANDYCEILKNDGYIEDKFGYIITLKGLKFISDGGYTNELTKNKNEKELKDEIQRLTINELEYKATLRKQEQRIRNLTELSGYWELAKKFWGITIPIVTASTYGIIELVCKLMKGISILKL